MKSGYKYKIIAESLRQRIKNGGINQGDFLPTSKKLADEYSTTAVTIDRAIALLVEEGLVTRTPGVGTVVQEKSLRTMPVAENSSVGVLLQAQTDSYYWERLLEGISDILRPAGIATLIGYHDQSTELALEHAELFSRQGVNVILFVPFDRSSAESYESDNRMVIHALREMGMQVVMLDRYISSVSGHYITDQSYVQGKEMVQTLLASGFQNPVCISTDYVSAIAARESSFLDACVSMGVDEPASRIHRLPLKVFQDKEYDLIEKLIHQISASDLIICLNSRIFNTLIYLMAKLGLTNNNAFCPKFAGFVDIELMDLENVAAYVEQPIREIGHAAGRMAKLLLSESVFEYLHALVPCELRIID